VRIDTRWATTNTDDLRKHAAELAASTPDVLVAASGTATVAALLQATRTVPIVFVVVIDPVGAGFVPSLARPGGNVTGFLAFEYGLSGKWLEVLKQIAPEVKRVAVLRDATIASGIGQFGAIQSAAPSLGMEASPVNVRDVGDIERDIAAFARSSNGGAVVTASPEALRHRDMIITLAARHRLPAVYAYRTFVSEGRPDLLWTRFCRPVPPRGRIRRSHPQRREAPRPSGAGTDQVRAGHQHEDRPSARPRRATDAARPR
jgi:putative ABC transport system substrate-binding protein